MQGRKNEKRGEITPAASSPGSRTESFQVPAPMWANNPIMRRRLRVDVASAHCGCFSEHFVSASVVSFQSPSTQRYHFESECDCTQTFASTG